MMNLELYPQIVSFLDEYHGMFLSVRLWNSQIYRLCKNWDKKFGEEAIEDILDCFSVLPTIYRDNRSTILYLDYEQEDSIFDVLLEHVMEDWNNETRHRDYRYAYEYAFSESSAYDALFDCDYSHWAILGLEASITDDENRILNQIDECKDEIRAQQECIQECFDELSLLKPLKTLLKNHQK